MKKQTVIILAVLIAIAAFAGGTFYGKASVPAVAGRGTFAGGAGLARNASGTNGRFLGNGGGVVAGQIISKDSQSVTLQLSNGNSEVAFYSPSTQVTVTKTSVGSAADLASGTMIIVTSSTPNSDGSITAQAIQIRTLR